jgi:hypothetical protein
MGGWLLLLGASLLFAAAMTGWRLFDLPDAHGSIFIAGPVTLRMAEAAFTLAVIVLQLTLAWLLVRQRKPVTVPRVIAGLWLVPLIDVVLRSLFNGWLLGLAPAALVRQIAAEGQWEVLMAAIWTIYLRRSKRVANTYRRHDADRLAAVFG